MTIEAAQRTVDDLERRLRDAQGVLADCEAKRERFSLAAAQGDADAVAPLDEVERDEAQAAKDERSLLPAVKAARANLDALEREAAEEAAATAAEAEAAACKAAVDALLDVDDRIAEALTEAAECLRERDALLTQQGARLRGAAADDRLAFALCGPISLWLPNQALHVVGSPSVNSPALHDLDGDRFDRMSERRAELGPREPTPTERLLEQAARRPSWIDNAGHRPDPTQKVVEHPKRGSLEQWQNAVTKHRRGLEGAA